ncbi:helix-turn-helix domain-containing protein [Paenibacillus frigoriresistens]|uniref:response regulator transcription factor n=1 Tax=Paenibacillus alginolyticus TaxID=59839 RepID=UPI0015672255|nr:helix-turn-helix domain-containing protein [Paenibacillus frigoriresistens]NRF93730.1 helix-turn-helix domain-containing protein [Paenibacillus frigoriresistens]
MNIVIADDEQLAREAMTCILLELFPDLHLHEARNGQELIEIVERIKPEAAFVDIKMPGKSGLEAIQDAAPSSPHTQWVILTGFADFSYAKEAIRVRAIEYLLKPIGTEDVQALITKIQQTALLQINEKNKLFESDMLSLFHGLILNWDERETNHQPSSRFRCQIIYMDSHYPEAEKSASSKPFFHTMSSTMSQYYHKDLELATLLLPSGEWVVVGKYTSSQGAEQLEKLFSSHTALVQQVEELGLAFTLVVSEECDSYPSLLDEVTKLHKNSYLRCSLGISQSWTARDLCEVESQPIISELCHTLIKSVDEYHKRNFVNYMNNIEQFIKIYETKRDWISIKTSQTISRFLNCSIHAPILTSSNEENWFQSLRNLGQKLLDKKTKQVGTTPDLVTKTIAYIENHYTGDLSLGHVAEEFCVTPNHLSSLFHKRTGTTFMQYVTKLRMLKAKELLSDPSVQVQQAAEQVGYFSSRHFTKLFKEFAGCYPSEYKKNSQITEEEIPRQLL